MTCNLADQKQYTYYWCTAEIMGYKLQEKVLFCMHLNHFISIQTLLCHLQVYLVYLTKALLYTHCHKH